MGLASLPDCPPDLAFTRRSGHRGIGRGPSCNRPTCAVKGTFNLQGEVTPPGSNPGRPLSGLVY